MNLTPSNRVYYGNPCMANKINLIGIVVIRTSPDIPERRVELQSLCSMCMHFPAETSAAGDRLNEPEGGGTSLETLIPSHHKISSLGRSGILNAERPVCVNGECSTLKNR